MADPTNVLQPNYMGDTLGNLGVESMSKNYGLGVAEATAANPMVAAQREEKANPAATKDKLRTAKAREFGKTKETIGF